MSITITPDLMTPGWTSPHAARRIDGPEGLWRVTWLPGRTLTYNQAITAMTIVEANHGWKFRDQWLIDELAPELGLTGMVAVEMIETKKPVSAPHTYSDACTCEPLIDSGGTRWHAGDPGTAVFEPSVGDAIDGDGCPVEDHQ